MLAIGLVVSIWILLQDNHKKRIIQRELEIAKNQAEQANKAKSQLVANISHEMRTPLGAIQGFADLIGNYDSSDEEKNRSLRAISNNSRHLLELVNDFLDLSKIESGLLEVEITQFHLIDLIYDIVECLRSEAENKNLQLIVEFLGSIPEKINSDPKRLRQILLNLLANAIKFTESGFVKLSVKLADEQLEKQGSKKILFEIEDSGIGIDENQKKRIFKPFFQADASISRRFGGTGLGLALSRNLAQLIKGELTLSQSKPHVGSKFSLTLDCGSLSQTKVFKNFDYKKYESNKRDTYRPEFQISGIKILVVEDCKDNQVIYKTYLESEGVFVDIAENGIEGFKKALENHYDLILMDVQMPLQDGYTTTMNLRQQGYQVPIIALTAHAMKGEQERCFESGCDGYLTKPITAETLISAISYYHSLAQRANLSGKAINTIESPFVEKNNHVPLFSNLKDDPRINLILETFITGLDDRIAKMRKAVNEQDLNSLKKESHRLKGTAGNYGFPDIAKIANQLENIEAASPAKQSATQLIDNIETLSNRAKRGILKKIDGAI